VDAHQEKDLLMASSKTVNLKIPFTWLVALVIFLICAAPAQARENMPTLSNFIESVRDGNANSLRGVYIQGVMAHRIVQQPSGQPGYVSQDKRVITQFNMAAKAGNVGLLAHNYLAGATFTQLAIGQQVDLVYGDGRVESFIVSQILRYQALDPKDPMSEFRNVNSSIIKAEELFRQVYGGKRHVTFQTCIESNGNSSWGRLFIIAQPKRTE
jgi:hypothetical protein